MESPNSSERKQHKELPIKDRTANQQQTSCIPADLVRATLELASKRSYTAEGNIKTCAEPCPHNLLTVTSKNETSDEIMRPVIAQNNELVTCGGHCIGMYAPLHRRLVCRGGQTRPQRPCRLIPRLSRPSPGSTLGLGEGLELAACNIRDPL